MTPEILSLLFPQDLPTTEEIEARYPPRNLPAGAVVSRVAPSPTGFMHSGTLYQALFAERAAHQSGGVFYLRIEDTDQERYVEGAVPLIINSLAEYNVFADEGATLDGKEKGNYGPYTQSQRKSIYQTYVKKLVQEGKAYPCFCTHEEVDLTRKVQEKQGLRPGYYGKYAKCRNLSDSQILENLKANKPFVIRIKSTGDYNRKIVVRDLFKGAVQMPENDMDIVILKQDGLPTYHFAHLIDDHLMQTTHVTRGDEWLSSAPLHLQLFALMGWQAPLYGHIAPLTKLDNGNKRKLSKRHDPEATLSYFSKKGYPKEAVIEYLLNLINSNFEDWRRENPTLPITDFPFNFNKVSNTGGALFDFQKLDSISKEIIAKMDTDTVYDFILKWAKTQNTEFATKIEHNQELIKKALGIERNIGPKSRKDLVRFETAPLDLSFFLAEEFEKESATRRAQLSFDDTVIDKVVQDFWATYDETDTKEEWFEKVKQVAAKNGFATDTKSFKANPKAFKGSVADVAKILRVLVTGREKSPDLCGVMQVLGKETVYNRLTGGK